MAALLTRGIRTARSLPPASLYVLHSYVQYPALRLGRGRAVPFVYDAHDFYSSLSHDGRPRPLDVRLAGWFDGLLERACVKRAAAVVTVSEGVADLMEARFGRRPAVVRNGHDRRLDNVGAGDVRTALALSDSAFLLVVVGNYKRGMAVECALDALRLLPAAVHWVWIGAGYDHWRKRASEAGLAGRAHFVNPVAPDRVRPFISSADVAPILYQPLTASLRNALPNGFFHAVAAGLPVLYPEDLPELSRLARQHGLGEPIDPRDPAGLAEAVESLRKQPDRRGAVRARVESSQPQLAWEREEERLLELVRPLLAGRTDTCAA